MQNARRCYLTALNREYMVKIHRIKVLQAFQKGCVCSDCEKNKKNNMLKIPDCSMHKWQNLHPQEIFWLQNVIKAYKVKVWYHWNKSLMDLSSHGSVNCLTFNSAKTNYTVPNVLWNAASYRVTSDINIECLFMHRVVMSSFLHPAFLVLLQTLYLQCSWLWNDQKSLHHRTWKHTDTPGAPAVHGHLSNLPIFPQRKWLSSWAAICLSVNYPLRFSSHSN